ncbi:MAG: 23S rRNA (cytidine(2498)-2'-O)-methyltransferase RlmM [Burkholderiales bacterium]|nr:23S rRNA (cytidine(2498)-2'-O)-methyltransferase RlmM [Burkholderiales bacterium]
MNAPDALLAYCRAGFESEAAEELLASARTVGTTLRVLRADPQSGFALLVAVRPFDVSVLRRLDGRTLCFCRQVIWTSAEPLQLGDRDRVSPIAAALDALRIFAGELGEFWVEHPDTNDGKSLSTLGRAIEPRIAQVVGLKRSGAWRAHAFLLNKAEAQVGLTLPGLSIPWRMGIPRLRMPGEAPSRSTLKLAEALLFFLGGHEEEFLKPGMRAVDLGAAPGGWTWQLIHRGLHVTAVDNGELKGELRDNALVKHLREDGFRYRPKRPVEWLVCDMVEQPVRIATLVAEWVATDTAQHAIFNLKLPMKKRMAELARCRAVMAERMDESGAHYHLAFRQLYHDREEVTGFLTRHAKRLDRLQRLNSTSVS